MPKVGDQRWSCHSCSDCCRTLVGHLFDDERDRLDQQHWRERLGVDPYVRVGRGSVLNKRPDGACVFLDENNRCRIHAEFGEAAKPLACRIFPFSVRPVRGGWQASLRFDCPSVVKSDGVPLAEHRPWLRELAERLEHRVGFAGEVVHLQNRRIALPEEVEAFERRLRRLLHGDGMAIATRVVGIARIAGMLESATLPNVRGARFVELLDLLFAAASNESRTPPLPPTGRQSGLLRQLAFAHAEHLSLREMRAPFPRRLARRWRQLRSARRFHRGRGEAPPLPGIEGRASFDEIERVQAIELGSEDAAAAEKLVNRYLTARIEGRAVFGAGYFGWPMFVGFAALALSIAVTGWLARYAAVSEGRARLTFFDVGRALGLVDRAIGRLPALGAVSERLRTSYLLKDDGAARLLRCYGLTEEAASVSRPPVGP